MVILLSYPLFILTAIHFLEQQANCHPCFDRFAPEGYKKLPWITVIPLVLPSEAAPGPESCPLHGNGTCHRTSSPGRGASVLVRSLGPAMVKRSRSHRMTGTCNFLSMERGELDGERNKHKFYAIKLAHTLHAQDTQDASVADKIILFGCYCIKSCEQRKWVELK